MAQEIRALVQGLIIIVVVAGAMYSFIFGFINSNGGNVPVNIQHNVTTFLKIANTTVSGAVGNSTNSTSGAIISGTSSNTGGILGVIGFGGAIISFIGFIGALPHTMGYVVQILGQTYFLGLIVIAVSGAALLLTSSNIVFELMSWIGKYRI